MGLLGKIAKGFTGIIKGIGKAVTSPEGLLTAGAIAVGFVAGGPVGAAAAAKYAAIGGGALGVVGLVTGNQSLASLGSNIAITGVLGGGIAGIAGGMQRASALGVQQAEAGVAETGGFGAFKEGFGRTIAGQDPLAQMPRQAGPLSGVPGEEAFPFPGGAQATSDVGATAVATPQAGAAGLGRGVQIGADLSAINSAQPLTSQQLEALMGSFQKGNARGWFLGLEPVFQTALIAGGMQVVGGMMAGISGADALDLQEAMQEKELEFKRDVRSSSPGVQQFDFGRAVRPPLIQGAGGQGQQFQGAQVPSGRRT